MFQPPAEKDPKTKHPHPSAVSSSTLCTLPYDVIIYIVQCGEIGAADAIALRRVRPHGFYQI